MHNLHVEGFVKTCLVSRHAQPDRSFGDFRSRSVLCSIPRKACQQLVQSVPALSVPYRFLEVFAAVEHVSYVFPLANTKVVGHTASDGSFKSFSTQLRTSIALAPRIRIKTSPAFFLLVLLLRGVLFPSDYDDPGSLPCACPWPEGGVSCSVSSGALSLFVLNLVIAGGNDVLDLGSTPKKVFPGK